MSFRICYATAIAISHPTQIPQPVLIHSRRRGPASAITPREYIKYVKPTRIPRPVTGHGLRAGQVHERKYTKIWSRAVIARAARLPPVYEEAAGSGPLAMIQQPDTVVPAILEEKGSSPIVTTPAAPEVFEEWAGSSSFDTIPRPNSGDEAYSYWAPGGGRHRKRVARAIGRFFCL